MTKIAPLIREKKGSFEPPHVLLRQLDGKRFFLPRYRESGAVTGRADMAAEMLNLHDDQKSFVGCYLAYQLPFIGYRRFHKSIQMVGAADRQAEAA